MFKKLRLFNSITSCQEEFEPIDPSRVTMYVCGPTIYSVPHVGNMRSVAVYDMIYKTLRRLYKDVVFARNLTDVDDKIINAASQRGCEVGVITGEAYDGFVADCEYINCSPPNN